jgi:hypothetical protein
MKTLIKVALVVATLCATVTTRAEGVRGYFRSNGAYVMPYYRTPANGIPYDNLSYRGFPSQQPGYVSPRSYGFGSSLNLPSSDFRLPSCRSSFKGLDTGMKTMPKLPGTYKIRTYGF